MTALRLLNLRRIADAPLRTAVAILAVAAGVALTLGVVVARSSVDRSFDDISHDITGPAALRVRGPAAYGGLDAAVLDDVRAVDGVATAIPLVTGIVVATDSVGDDHLVLAFGVDCTIESILGAIGCDPALLAAGGDVPLLPAALAADLGADGVVRTDAGVVPVGGAATTAALDQVNQGRVVVWPLPVAQRLLTREGRLDHVLVVPDADVDPTVLRSELAGAVGDHNVVDDADTHVDSTFVTEQLLPGLLLTSLLGLVVGVQLVHTTFALAFEERRRELAVTAAVGATPRLVAAGLLAEAAILGAIGGVLGTAGAALTGGTFVAGLSGQVERLSGLQLSVHLSPSLVLLGIAVGVLAAVTAAIRPARAAARLDLAGELAERERHDPRLPRRRLGLIVASAGTVGGLVVGWLGWRDGSIERWQPTAAFAGIVIASTCAFRLPGALAADAVRLVGRTRVGRRGPVHVAVGSLLGDPRRTASVTNALGAVAMLSIAAGSIFSSVTSAAEREANFGLGNGVYVSPLGTNNITGIDAKLPPAAQADLAAVPGVASLEPVRFSSIDHPDIGDVGLVATDATSPVRVFRGDGPEASRRAGRVMVGPAFARDLGLDPGDSFTVPGTLGGVDLTVGGIWASPENIGSSITLDHDTFTAIVGDRPASFHIARPEPGVSPTELARRIKDADVHDRLLVLDPDAYGAALAREFEEFGKPFVALQRALFVVGFAATLSTLLLAAVQRRREMATLVAVGMPPADLGRMVLAEAGILGVVATAVGAVGGMVTYVTYGFASLSVSGLDTEWVLPWRPVPIVGVAVVAVAVAGAAWPAWRSTRIEPALALRYE